MLTLGDPAPWFTARYLVHPSYSLAEAAAGRFLVLCFFGSAADPAARRVLVDIEKNQHRFDLENVCFVGVSTDPDDERLGRLQPQFPGLIFLWDADGTISRQYGAAKDGADYHSHSVVLDPSLRVIAAISFQPQPEAHVAKLLRFLDTLPPVRALTGFAPILCVPWVFEPDFCRTLIAQYEKHGGEESGFVVEREGQSVRVLNPALKRRKDHHLSDDSLVEEILARLRRRLLPEIKKAFQFEATRIEHHVVACYDADRGGYVRPHRDDSTPATAHRRFAVTINLNAGDYEGGDLRFAEYGPRTYRATIGGAVVYSCSLLHEALPVTKGRRYAYLPYLADESVYLLPPPPAATTEIPFAQLIKL
jgi:peroxiredoxin